ncbi:MAG TPA: RNA methyltransferase [Terracidiphilus sp.]|nr:RNA methyltransferase [Terracidiphilus sp.]
MPVRIVQSKQNARLKELRKALARPGRDTHGLAGIEGPHLIEEAFRAGLRVKTIFASSKEGVGIDIIDPSPGAPHSEAEVLLVPGGLLNSMLETESPQAVAALVEMPDWTWAHILHDRGGRSPLVIVLAGVQDPGNLGTIVRSAEAFGATGVVALPGTVSAWNPKAVRASAGSIFRMPLVAANAKECFDKLREAGARILTTDVRGTAQAHEANLTGPVAFLIGNEGNGVPPDVATHADGALTIPCPGPVESLNAAVAASVLLYEASRQRSAASHGRHKLRGSTR